MPLLADVMTSISTGLKVAMKVLAFAVMLIGGRYLLRPVFRFIAASGGVRGGLHCRDAVAGADAALFMDALMAPVFIAGVLPAEYLNTGMSWKMLSIPLKVYCLGCSLFRRYVAKSRRTPYTHLPWWRRALLFWSS